MLIEEKTVKSYIGYVEEYLVERYGYTLIEARQAMIEADFEGMLRANTEQIFENSPPYWAKKIAFPSRCSNSKFVLSS